MDKRTLGIDFGSVRIGFAISDLLGITAQGLETLSYKNEKQIMAHMQDLIREKDIGIIVVGLPLNMNGSRGPIAEKCEAFGSKLKEIFKLPVVFWDERLTTVAAEKQMIEFDISRSKRRKAIDRMAAQIMLQSYLDMQSMKEQQDDSS